MLKYCQANNLLLVSISLSIICLRPSIFGENFGPIVLVVLFILSMVYIILNNNIKVQVRNNTKTLFGLLFVFLIYVGVQSIFTATNFRPVLSSILSTVVLIPLFLVLISNKRFIFIFNKTLVVTLLFLIVSSLVTYSMFFLNLEIKLFDVQTHQNSFREGYVALYFPFSLLGANAFHFISDFFLERAFGMFREPGVFQMYLIYAYYVVAFELVVFKYRKVVMTLLIIGLFTTFSAAGIFVILVLETLRNATAKLTIKKIFSLIFFLAIVIFSYDFLYHLLEARLLSNSAADRFGTLDNILLQQESILLFGNGFKQAISEVSTVNFLGSALSIGVIGSTLYFLIWTTALLDFKMYKFYLLMPFLLTLLLAQPIYTDPIIFLILLFANNNFGVTSSNINFHIKKTFRKAE